MTKAEALRKLAHIAAFWPALTLAWLTPIQALLVTFSLLLMNLLVLPRFAKVLYRPREPGLGALEIILYPAALMACVVAFGTGKPGWYLPVTAAWFGIAFVDAFIGLACRLFPSGPTLPWNSRKPMLGVLIGTAAAMIPAALLFKCAFLFKGSMPFHSTWTWVSLVIVAAFAETLWFGIADNIVIPFFISVLLPLLPMTAFLMGHGWMNLIIPLGFGFGAWAAGWLTLGGATLGALLALLLVLANPWLFAFLGGFFLLGNLATRFGFQRKLGLGIAEARGGKRGAAEVFGALGLAAWMTPLVHLSKGDSPSHWSHALLVCIAPLVAKTMDTVSSEIGKAMSGKTISLKTLRPVPPGTKGGVSLSGSLWGLSAALALTLPILGLGWGGPEDVGMLVLIALAANIFESYWGEWAKPKGIDTGAHTNVLMTLVAAILGWLWWFN